MFGRRVSMHVHVKAVDQPRPTPQVGELVEVQRNNELTELFPIDSELKGFAQSLSRFSCLQNIVRKLGVIATKLKIVIEGPGGECLPSSESQKFTGQRSKRVLQPLPSQWVVL